MDDLLPSPPILPSPLAPPAYDRRRVVRWAVIVALVLLGAFLLLQNSYWVPGGDSDFYVSIARSMARSAPTWRHPFAGFLYNGLPVAISPPGWPWLMARIMAVSPTFLALKFTAMLSMYGALVIGFFIALRFLRPSSAGLATVLAGLLMPVYSLTYFLHSEGLYSLLSAAALLLALRLREGRGGTGHRVALLALCVMIPLVRWAGIFQLLPIVAVLMSGPRTLALAARHWRTALACAVAIIGTWATMRQALVLSEEETKRVQDEGGITTAGNDSGESTASADSQTVEVFGPPKDAKHGIVYEYCRRVVVSGKWFAWLLWQPTRFVSIHPAADLAVNLIGWGVIALLAYLAVVEARRGEWLWVSLAMYTGAICFFWDNVNSRYFVPVAPLILVGVLLATRRLGQRFRSPSFDAFKWLRRGLVYTVLAANLAMYGVDVIVMRSAKFYETFEAGQHREMIAIAWHLMALPPAPPPTTRPAATRSASATTSSVPTPPARPENYTVLINDRYENLGRVRESFGGSRALVLLTDRFIKPMDYKGNPLARSLGSVKPPLNPRMGRVMRQRRTEWYVAQLPVMPWRLWHFRVPDWLFTRMTRQPPQPPSGGWVLYRFNRIDSTFAPQTTPPVENWPTRVPGM